jgi:hypothetical protein
MSAHCPPGVTSDPQRPIAEQSARADFNQLLQHSHSGGVAILNREYVERPKVGEYSRVSLLRSVAAACLASSSDGGLPMLVTTGATPLECASNVSAVLTRVMSVLGRESSKDIVESNDALFRTLSLTLKNTAEQALATIGGEHVDRDARRAALETIKRVSAIGRVLAGKMTTLDCSESVASEFISCWQVNPYSAASAVIHDRAPDISTFRCLLAKHILEVLPADRITDAVRDMFRAFKNVRRFCGAS